MFCGKCGAQNEDGSQFCKNCGAALNAAPSVEQAAAPAAAPAAAAKQPDYKKIGLIATVAVVLLAAVLLFSVLGGSAAEKTAGKLIDAVFKADGKAIVALVPKDMLDDLNDELGFDTKKELTEYLTETLEGTVKYLDRVYDKWSYSYKILSTEDYKGKDLSNLMDRYEDNFDIKIKEAKTVSVKLTLKSDGKTENETIDITVVKVGGSWYVDYLSMGDFF